jgi:hypothetical protein
VTPEEAMQAFGAILEAWRLQLDGMEGMVTEARNRGYTDDQARAMVAYMFGWRASAEPPEGQ